MGIIVIITGGVLIGIGKPSQNSDDTTDQGMEIQRKYLFLSIFFAVLCGVTFALNSLVMKYYVKKFNFGVV